MTKNAEIINPIPQGVGDVTLIQSIQAPAEGASSTQSIGLLLALTYN